MDIYHETRKPIESEQYLYECTLQQRMGRATVARPHIHECFEALYCTQGSFHLRIGGRPFDLHTGDMALIDPMEAHQTQAAGAGENAYIVLKFMPQVLYSAEQPLHEMGTLLPYLRFGDTHEKLFPAQAVREAGMDATFGEIYREFAQRGYGYALATRAGIGRLFVWVLRRWHERNAVEALSETSVRLLERAFVFIERNYAQEITMRDAARACDMSYTAFSRFFSRYARQGFAQTLLQVRLKKAMFLLLTTELSTTEIAMQTGFSTASYFIQRFREVNGMTPGRYRRGVTP